MPIRVVVDRGYSSHAVREHIGEQGARPTIPARRNEEPVACPNWVYNNRSMVERLWARLKEWRAIATVRKAPQASRGPSPSPLPSTGSSANRPSWGQAGMSNVAPDPPP